MRPSAKGRGGGLKQCSASHISWVSADSVKSSGVIPDPATLLEKNVASTMKIKCSLGLFQRTAPNLDPAGLAIVIHTAVTSRLDCCNCSPWFCSGRQFHIVQNATIHLLPAADDVFVLYLVCGCYVDDWLIFRFNSRCWLLANAIHGLEPTFLQNCLTKLWWDSFAQLSQSFWMSGPARK